MARDPLVPIVDNVLQEEEKRVGGREGGREGQGGTCVLAPSSGLPR
jgi:hypothetical protein